MMIQSLLTSYDDARLAKMLIAAKGSSGADAAATRIQDAQLKNWVANDESLDDVFRLLKLDDEGTNFLQSPMMEVWAAYAMRLDENRAGEMMFLSLKTRFDDVSLAKMLYEANKAPNPVASYSIKRLLKEAQLMDWKAKRKTLDDVFGLLKLDGEGAKIFENPVISAWSSYASKLHGNRAGEEMLQSLRTRYDEVTVTTMLAQAKTSTTGGSVATRPETAQRKLWTDTGKTVDDVFRLLKLGDEGDKVFQSPVVGQWAVYAIKRDGDCAGELMFQSLMTRHDDAGLTKMLLEAKKSPDRLIKATATKIENAQLANWIRKERTVDDVYHLLKLDDEGAKLFESPVVNVWVSYATKVDESRAGEMLLQSLKTHFDGASVAEMLTTGASRPYNVWKIIKSAQDTQLAQWMAEGKTVDDIYRLLKLDEEGSKLFDSQVINVWASYATKLDNERGGEMI